MNIPNAVSGLRIALVPVFAWLYLSRRSDVAALAVLAVAASTDWLDGFLARRLGQVTELGKLLDPVADRIGVVIVGWALVIRGAVWAPLAAAILLRELVIAAGFLFLQARHFPRIEVSRIGKVSTALILGGLVLAASASAFNGPGPQLKILSTAVLAAGAAAYWVAGGLYLKEARRMAPTQG